MKNKVILFVFMLSIIIGSGWAISANAAVAIPYKTDFNTYKSIGSGPIGWDVWMKTDEVIEGALRPGETGKDDYCLHLNAKSKAALPSAYAYLSEPFYDGKIELKADFYVVDNTIPSEIFGLSAGDTKDNNLLSFRDGKIVLKNCKESISLPEEKWFTLKLIYISETGELQLTVDEKTYEGSTYLTGALTTIKFTHHYVEGKTGDLYIDNLSVTPLEPEKVIASADGTVPVAQLTDDEIQKKINEKLSDALSLFIGSNTAILKNERKKIDEDKLIVPQIINGRTMLPLRFIAEAFHAKVDWNAEKQQVTLISDTKTIVFTVGEANMLVNGVPRSIDSPPVIINSRTLLPIRAISNVLNKKVFWDAKGLVVISNTDELFDSVKDNKLIIQLINDLIYERPSQEELMELLLEKNPNNQHPRFFGSDEDFARAKENIKNDAQVSKWFTSLEKTATDYYNKSIITYGVKDSIGRVGCGWEMHGRMLPLVAMYRYTGDKKWLDKAWENLQAAANFEDWNPSQFLDCAEMTAAFGVSYDWLYNDLTEEQRTIIRTAIIEKGLKPALDVYNGKITGPWGRAAWATVTNNWNMVCNNGILLGAIAIADEDPIGGEIVKYGLQSLERSLSFYYPDGGWDEGPQYWSYGTSNLLECLTAIDTTFGTTFGLFKAPGLSKTAYFPPYVSGPTGIFNYHDSVFTPNPITITQFFWVSNLLGDPNIGGLRANALNTDSKGADARDILLYNSDKTNSNVELPFDGYFRQVETASARSSWSDENATYIGFHGGSNSAGHGHLDIGTFVIDAMGERWAEDLGPEDYNMPGYFDSAKTRWTYYRTRAEAHNTLVFDTASPTDQGVKAFATIEKTESKPNGYFAIMDMTEAYENSAKSVKRGVMLIDNRKNIILQDEIKTSNYTNLWWFMSTTAKISISEDGKTAILTKNGQTMKAILSSPSNAVFTITEALPLPTSPNPAGQAINKKYKKLTISLKNARDTVISVEFIPLYNGVDTTAIPKKVVPLEKWTIEDVNIELPRLNKLNINGTEIECKVKNKFMYTYKMPKDTKLDAIPKVVATGDGKIDITYPESIPNIITVNLTDERGTNTYYIKVIIDGFFASVKIPADAKKLNVVDVKASGDDGNISKNVIDGDILTRWSVLGNEQWITLDLGATKKIMAMNIIFYNGASRQTIFDVQTSNDNNQWQTVYSGMSSGTMTNFEAFILKETKGRYIRVLGYGNTTNAWNSIIEAEVYGRD